MFYYRDFNHKYSRNTYREFNPQLQSKIFTVILETNNNIKSKVDKYSIINAAKPLAYYTSVFGTQMKKSEVHKVKLYNKIYTSIVIVVLCLIYTVVSPISWRETKADVPLNILTRSFSYLTATEVIYIIFVSNIGNSEHYLRLMKKFDDFDQHFMTSKEVFIKERIFAISLIFISVLILCCVFLLHNVHIHNIGPYFNLYIFILQGSVTVFFLSNIHVRLLIFNDLLLSRLSKTLPWKCKTSIFEDSFGNKLVKVSSFFTLRRYPSKDENVKMLVMKILSDSQILGHKLRSHSNWFELMQMYDKAADCVYLFNKIYAGQAFLMFQSSLFCTVLFICRYLSPSLKHSYFMASDLYIYLCIIMRPMYLAKMCDVLSNQKNKTLLMLMTISVHSKFDVIYRDQLQTMINLVRTRKMEITCNVFTANLQTSMNFSGRVISYTVLMIQYFYKHSFSE